MKYILLFILFLSLPFYSAGQKLHRQYSFYPQEEGNVYFIHPQKGFENNGNGPVKKMEYDITYLSGKDSASYTFTYYSENPMQIDSVKIMSRSGQLIYAEKATMFYVQPKKTYWQQRASVSIPYDLLVEIYQNENPYSISLSGGKRLDYEMKPKRWKKQAELVSKIFDVVKYNK